MKKKLFGLLAGATVLAATGTAQAIPLTYEYAGTVTYMSGPTTALPANIALGADFVVTFTFESTAPDTNGLSNEGHYGVPGAPFYNFTVTIGTTVFPMKITSAGGIIVGDDDTGGTPTLDQYRVVGHVQDAFGYTGIYAAVALYDSTLSVLSSDALPLTPPDPADFNYLSALVLQGVDELSETFYIRADFSPTSPITVQDLSVSVSVPEPSAIVLFAVGLAGLGGLAGFRSARKRRPSAG